MTKSRRCTNKSKDLKSKSRSGKRKSKKPRVSRRAHSLRGGSQVASIHQNNPTTHNKHSTNQHPTPPPVDKEDKWTKTGRALMYGVGAAGTGALMGVSTGLALTPNQYTENDLEEWNEHMKGVIKVSPQQLQQQKQIFLLLKNVEHYTENNKKQIKQNAVIGAGLAAAAAGTYGATRHKKDANATKPGKLTRAGRALMYGVGAVGTGAAIGAAASKTGPRYTQADLHEGGSLKEDWDYKKLIQKRIQNIIQDNPDKEISAELMAIYLLTEQTFLDQKNAMNDITYQNNKVKNAMIGAGLAAVAAGTYGATRD